MSKVLFKYNVYATESGTPIPKIYVPVDAADEERCRKIFRELPHHVSLTEETTVYDEYERQIESLAVYQYNMPEEEAIEVADNIQRGINNDLYAERLTLQEYNELANMLASI